MQPTHQHISIDGLNLFYRQAGPVGAPTVLLLHGSPSSSIAFGYMLAELSDRWHLIAPDLPAFGFTEIPSNLPYSFTFDNLAMTISRFIEQLSLTISAVYLHDYGAQVGFRLLTSETIHPKALIIQNSEAYQGIGWRAPMKAVEKRLSDPPEKARARLLQALLNKDGIRKEFLEELPSDIALRIDPAVIELGWNKVRSAGATDAMLELLMDYGSNFKHYAKIQACLRANAFPALLLWGEADQYLSTEAAHAYQRDLPNAEFHFLDGGHWLLESHIKEVNAAVRNFLSTHISRV
jgi:pimeloyl-ACP methyl ester carboxylesterase